MSELKERNMQMVRCYSIALQQLRTENQDEFHRILQNVYLDHGLVVRKRLTGKRKQQALIEEARKLLTQVDEI